MSGSTKDYSFGQKNNWRRTLWNEVLRRTDGRERSEAILYLAGPQDLDRPVAVSKGVPDRNLIAIDLSFTNVRNIRSASHYAIHADAIDVLRAWPESVPVCAVVLDFCHGLVSPERIQELSDLVMFQPALASAVLAVNFMRGRDHASNIATTESKSVIEYLRGNPRSFAHLIDHKHRGFTFALWHAVRHCVDEAALRRNMEEPLANLQWMNPNFLSYRSGTLVFDSAVITPLSSRLICDEPELLVSVFREQYPKEPRVVRKIAATLATRTRQSFQ